MFWHKSGCDVYGVLIPLNYKLEEGDTSMFTHILVNIDPMSAEQPALDRGIALAKASNAELELFMAVYQNSIVANWILNEAQLELAKQHYMDKEASCLEQYAQRARDAGVKVKTDIWWHKPLYEGIIKKAMQAKADLVIKNTHLHPKVNKLFFSVNDWQLLKACPVPVILAKARGGEYQKVMSALSLSDEPNAMDSAILNTTEGMSQLLSAEAWAAHCCEPIGMEVWQGFGLYQGGLTADIPDWTDYIRELENRQRLAFDYALSHHKVAPEHRIFKQGQAAEFLLDVVKEKDIDLIVMGTTYRSGFVGSTVEDVLDGLECDLMAVKPPGFCSPVK